MIDNVGIQLAQNTGYDRYPAIFAVAARYILAAGVLSPKILSYGSSTGEEALTLANKYFPDGSIVGLDVSENATATARARNTAPDRITFDISTDTALRRYGPYNIVFAMSVLCRWPETRNMNYIGEVFPFERFSERVAELDRHVIPGGLLVIYNANFSFLDSITSQKYDLILSPQITTGGFVKRFDRFNRELRHAPASDCIYRKRRAPAETIIPDRLEIRDEHGSMIGAIRRDF